MAGYTPGIATGPDRLLSLLYDARMDEEIKGRRSGASASLHYGSRRSRGLTPGEIEMAALLFGDSIDYGRVRIHGRRYMPFQPKSCCMTPNGNMYFHRSCFLPDYSLGNPSAVHWFQHEMAHVWQHQMGYAVRLRGAVRIGLSYDYDLAPGKTLADFNMEAQGDLLADYFVLKHLRSPAAMRQRRYAGSLPLYEEVLANFITDPSSVASLPRDYGRCIVLLKGRKGSR